MATARKDVELVIRAKDQATKAFDAIAKAANTLITEQDDLAKSGAGVDTALGRLGKALSGLNQIIKGVSLGTDLTKQMERAQAESDRLQKSMAETAAESSRLAKELERAGASTAELSARTAAAAAAVERQGEAVKKAKASQRELNTALNESVTTRDKLVKAEARLSASLAQQPAKVDKARERFNRLSAELQGMVEPTATFQERFEASVRSLAKAEGRLTGLQTSLEETRASIVVANTGISSLSSELEKAGAEVVETAAKLDSVKTEYKELGAAAKTAANEQKVLVRAQEDITEAMAQAEGRIEKTGAAMIELAGEQDKARAAMAQLAAEARGPLLKAFSQQQSALSQINNAFQANRKEIAAFSAVMKSAGLNVTGDMIAGFERLKVASNDIRGEYAQQKAALAALRGALSDGVTDIDQLNALYQRFSQTLVGSSAALNRVKATQATAAAEAKKLALDADRAADALDKQGRVVRSSGGAMGSAASATDRFSRAVRSLYGESRTAMSWTQRLRGEVLSLIAAYSGLYGVIGVLGQVVNAYQTLEAATSRLNVVMDGDESKTAEELDFIRRTAERLGIEFGSLAQEYSKFSVATKGTNLEGANTRKIFVAVAESARVNKVSMEEMAGTFVALTQIVSKGSVQMEELRQQLGDRLPGALQIMADGLGVTTEKLIEMTANGEVSSDALVGFADELTKRFGPQLANSLNTVTANMGFLQNSVTAALLSFGQAGFIDSFNELLIQLNETLRSSDFQAFISRISQGVGSLVDLLTFLVANFRAVAAVLTTVIAIKIIPFVMGTVGALKLLVFNARMASLSFTAVSTGMASMIPAAGAATGAVTGLGVALRALLSSTGIGLLVTVAATAFTLWGTGADKASEAMEAHRKIVDRVKNAYDAADKSNSKWAGNIEGATITEARVALEKAMAARNEAIDALRSATAGGMNKNVIDQISNLVDSGARTQVAALRNLIELFDKGEIKVKDFKDAISDIAENASNDTIKQMAKAILESADAAGEFDAKTEELEAVIRLLNGTATEADKVLLGLAEAADAASSAFDAEKLTSFNDALREMMDFLPELKDQLSTFDDLAAIDAAYNNAIANAQRPGDEVRAMSARNAAREAVLDSQATALLEDVVKNTGVTVDMFKEIFGSEGYRDKAYDDGYGTMTIGYGNTQIDGRAVQAGDTVTQTQAMKMAVDEMAKLVAFIEGKVDVPLSPKQMEALVSYAYNAGSGSLERDGILDALRKGDYAGAESAIRNGVDTSKGVYSQGLRDRRVREADLFSEGSDDPEIIQEQVEQERKKVETAAEYRAELAAQAEQQQFLIDIAKEDLITREQAKAVREATLEAEKAGVTLTAAQIDGIKARTAAEYAGQAQKEAETAVKERQAAVEQKVNDLLTQRTELEAQLQIYKDANNTEAMASTTAEIEAVNAQLIAAIANAQALNTELGGEGAAARNAGLETTRLEAEALAAGGAQVKGQWDQVGQMFASGLTNAFMKFAQAVANGENAMDAAKEAFLQFAADFLIKIAEMIIQQAILNALASFGFGGGGGGGGGLFGLFGTGHTGGVVGGSRIGSGNGTRRLPPAVFNSAPRFHEGGFPGLMPGEVPAVLQEGEEVLSKSDSRNALNGGGAAGGSGAAPAGDTKIVNAIDSASFLDAALSSKSGEKVILNYMRANSGAIKAAIG